MSGRCYGCGDLFKKFFSGEKGCKNCGFEFCKKCITKKIAVPKLKGEQHHVCDKCYKLLSSGTKQSKPRPQSPPKAHIKRMEALQVRGNTPVSGSSNVKYSSSSKVQKKYVGMDRQDAELERRLDKLKEDREKMTKRPDIGEIESRLANLKAGKPEPPSEQEMRDRLAKLQGKQTTAQTTPQHFAPEKRHEEEQIVDLMDELYDENQIEQRRQGNGTDHQPSSSQSQKSATNPDNVNIEEINAMIKKSAQELQLDAENALLSLQQDEQLMARLKELKKRPAATKDSDNPTDIHSMDNGDSDEENDVSAERLIKQYLEEAKLEEETAKAMAKSTQSMNEDRVDDTTGFIPEIYKPELLMEEEFPWCCICNDDAKIKCFDCDGDLYCAQCFGEGHNVAHMKDHDFERYPRRK